jgi:hypothetical protein
MSFGSQIFPLCSTQEYSYMFSLPAQGLQLFKALSKKKKTNQNTKKPKLESVQLK